MSDETSTDKTQSAVEGCAQACLNELRKAGGNPRLLLDTRSGGGWTVLLAAMPTPPAENGPIALADCDRDCLGMLSRATEPLSAGRVR